MKLATVGDVVLSNGKFAKAGTAGAIAVIAHVGNDTGDDTHKHGLALALADETGGSGQYNDEFKWEAAKNKCTSKTAVPDASWMLPSKTQMETMITGAGGSIADLADLANLKTFRYWTSTLNTDEDSDPAWIIQYEKKEDSDEYEWKWGWNNVYEDILVRACLAF